MSSDDGDSESLSPEALNYEYLNGRRYHGFKAGAYALPNDDEEQERMNLLHAIWCVPGLQRNTSIVLLTVKQENDCG